jgi:hypothetical protein
MVEKQPTENIQYVWHVSIQVVQAT